LCHETLWVPFLLYILKVTLYFDALFDKHNHCEVAVSDTL
jgi:hypothetical protein